MISKFTEKLKKYKEDNQGAAIVITIVAIAFIGMLVAMLVYMTYYNYLMKNIDKQNKDNFYTAEYALEVLNAGLQKDISDSMSAAYVKSMKESSGIDSEMMTLNFKNAYITNMKAKIGKTGNDKEWDSAHLNSIWTDAKVPVATSAGQTGAFLEAIGAGPTLVVTNNDYLTINNIKITYTNRNGYISIIETDIRLKVPNVDFAQSATKLNLEDFSLIANTSLINDKSLVVDTKPEDVSLGSAVFSVSGSVYGGKEGVVVAHQDSMNFIKDPLDEAGNVDVRYKLIAESITADTADIATAGVTIPKSYDTHVNDINVHTSNFKGDGNFYVGDDLDISGKGSKVTLLGNYRGYGNGVANAKGSSSILINGADTTIDFSKLDELVLSGHAYVGAKRYDADKDRMTMYELFENNGSDPVDINTLTSAFRNAKGAEGDKVEDFAVYEDMLNNPSYNAVMAQKELATGVAQKPQNTSDVLTGESISVKANQLLYLVPSECIGYQRDTDRQVVTSNPMTYAEYDKLVNTFDSNSTAYKQLQDTFYLTHPRTDVFDITKVQNIPDGAHMYELARLSVLWQKMGTSAFTSRVKPVFRRINGTVMVYVFFDFEGNEIAANEFYKAYYNYDKDSVNLYVNSYIKSMKWNTSLNSQLTLAGNMFYLNGNKEVVLIDDTLEDSRKYLNMGDWADDYSQRQEALMHTLKADYNSMTSTQAQTDVFDNIVDSTELAKLATKSFVFNTNATDVSAKLSMGDVVYPSSSCPANTAVIIAKGDVYVNANYDGLIFAGGNIYICNGCSKVTYNPNKVLSALKLENEDPVLGTKSYVYEALGMSGRISYGAVVPGSGEDDITIGDLITYQNWKKE